MSKICNKEVEVPNGIELNEKDYCTSLLSTLKDMEKNYAIAMTEASNEWLFQIYRDCFLDIADLQRKVYNVMFQNGWYVLESVSDTKLNDKYNMPSNEYDSLELEA
jgi:spore coat protein CotF